MDPTNNTDFSVSSGLGEPWLAVEMIAQRESNDLRGTMACGDIFLLPANLPPEIFRTLLDKERLAQDLLVEQSS